MVEFKRQLLEHKLSSQEIYERRIKIRQQIEFKQLDAKHTYFKICRLVDKTDFREVLPQDKVDECPSCKRKVYYDSKDSEGKVHVCLPCAQKFLKNDKGFEALQGDDIDDKSIGDPKMVEFQKKVLAQNEAGENRLDKDYKVSVGSKLGHRSRS